LLNAQALPNLPSEQNTVIIYPENIASTSGIISVAFSTVDGCHPHYSTLSFLQSVKRGDAKKPNLTFFITFVFN